MRLGSLDDVNTKIVEGLFASDLSYLQALYEQLNGDGGDSRDTLIERTAREFGVIGEE